MENYYIKYMLLLLVSIFINVCDAEGIELWREPVPIVKAGKLGSVIQDNGQLVHAIKASNDFYLFSEKGAGTKALVLIGTPMETMKFFAENKNSGIEMRMDPLNKIYMGISLYIPKQRFEGLFPMQDFMQQVVKQVACDYISLNTSVDAINALYDVATSEEAFISTIKSLVKTEDELSVQPKKVSNVVKKEKKKHFFVLSSNSNKKTTQKKNNLLYVKFSYLAENGMNEIATGKIRFGDLIGQYRNHMPDKGSIVCNR